MALSNKKIALIVGAAVLAALLLCCAAVVVAINLYAAGGGDNVEIPDMVGMTVADARDALWIRTEVQIVEADGAKPGTVVAQSHEPGSKTHHDDIVLLEVAGPLTVPDLIGMRANDVWVILHAEGFDTMDYAYDPDAPGEAGTVVSQDPGPGAESMTGEIFFTFAGEDPYPAP